jgi:hypothetical protein
LEHWTEPCANLATLPLPATPTPFSSRRNLVHQAYALATRCSLCRDVQRALTYALPGVCVRVYTGIRCVLDDLVHEPLTACLLHCCHPSSPHPPPTPSTFSHTPPLCSPPCASPIQHFPVQTHATPHMASRSQSHCIYSMRAHSQIRMLAARTHGLVSCMPYARHGTCARNGSEAAAPSSLAFPRLLSLRRPIRRPAPRAVGTWQARTWQTLHMAHGKPLAMIVNSLVQ